MMPTIQSIPAAASALKFDARIALSLATYSQQAYETDEPYFIQDAGDVTVLCFRGTKKIHDFITDAQFWKRAIDDHSGIKIHHGFSDEMDELLLPQVISDLLPTGADKSTLKPLVITGHSLGGALASLAAFFLQHENFPIRFVYTFASPRVGNSAWRREYNKLLKQKTFRVVCAGDLVPLIPGIFCPIQDGYRHVGREVLLNEETYRLNPSHYFELALDGWNAYRAIKRGDVDFVLEFHSCQNHYIETLEKITNT